MTTPAQRPATVQLTADCFRTQQVIDAIQRLGTALALLSSGHVDELGTLNNAHTQLRAAGDIIGSVDTWVREQITEQENQILAEMAEHVALEQRQ